MRFSRENSSIGERLWNISKDLGLKQLVSDPTRGEYLLDIVLADFGELMQVSVLPSLADHRVVCMDINVNISRSEATSREVLDFKHADWDGLKLAIKTCSWCNFLVQSNFDRSVDEFCNHLSNLCAQYIPP